MQLSKSINTLPKEKIEEMKHNFQSSTLERIQAGINLLARDVQQADLERLRAQENLKKNKQKMIDVRAQEIHEKKSSEKNAEKLIKEINHLNRKPMGIFGYAFWILVIIGIVYLGRLWWHF